MRNTTVESVDNILDNLPLIEDGSFELPIESAQPDTNFFNFDAMEESIPGSGSSIQLFPFEFHEGENTGGRNYKRTFNTETLTTSTTPSLSNLINNTVTVGVNLTVTPPNKFDKHVTDVLEETTEDITQVAAIQSTTFLQLNESNNTAPMINGTLRNSSITSDIATNYSLTTNQIIALATVIPAVIILFVAGLLLWHFIFSDKRHANRRVGVQEEEEIPAEAAENIPRSQSSLSKTLHSAALHENISRNGEGQRQLAWTNNESGVVEQTT